MDQPLKNPVVERKADTAEKWEILVDDRPVPMPRRHVKASLIRDQAGIPAAHALVRDHNSPNDPIMPTDGMVDLAEGNVFKATTDCHERRGTVCNDTPKLAYFVDDCWKVVVRSDQTGRTMRELFAIGSEFDLLRDLESPNDTPIGPDDSAAFADGPVFRTIRGEVDVEECGKTGCKPPQARRYVIRIDRIRYTVAVPKMTGLQLLELAGKNPKQWMILQKFRGGRAERVENEGIADFTCLGVERFVTQALDQTDG